eukprot:5593742-Amphidinium_carterae.1
MSSALQEQPSLDAQFVGCRGVSHTLCSCSSRCHANTFIPCVWQYGRGIPKPTIAQKGRLRDSREGLEARAVDKFSFTT